MPGGFARSGLGFAEPRVSRVRRLDGNLALDTGAVLPVLTSAQIRKALRRLTGAEIEEALRFRMFPVAWTPDAVGYAVAGEAAAARAEAGGLPIVAWADSDALRDGLQSVFSARLRWQAEAGLADRLPAYSARSRITLPQVCALLGSLLAAILAACLDGRAALLLFGALFCVFFLMVIGLRLLSLSKPRWPPAPKPRPLRDDQLPAYTVLVPLFRETAVLRQLIGALLAIRYPRNSLDIKLVLEASDIDMRRACAALNLPHHIETITVPCFGPQTKPKALNYALALSRGELVTIYDAEDIPDPDQLALAASTFANAPPHLACLQARLEFYEPEQNWLTRQFAAEYASLYGLILPVLAAHGLPMPLGGTSNHFRADVLRRIGAWDPFNVTEDADLGFRLARAGYVAGVIDSATEEEPNGNLRNWMSQRARWLKGWMQTWLVLMREPRRLHHQLGAHGFWMAQTLVGGIVVSALFHPFFLVLALAALVTGSGFPAHPTMATAFFGALGLAVLGLGYGVTIAAGAEGLRRLGIRGWRPTLATMPLYWLLVSAAAWLALWQLLRSPFAWNKTEHGLSRRRRRRR